MYQIHQNLDELTLSLFSWVLIINSKSTYFLNIFWRRWDNAAVFLSLLSFSRIAVYVLIKKQYMAKFAIVFYGFLLFGNMFTTFFINYRISLLFKRILQCLNNFLCNRVFLNRPLTSSQEIENLEQHVRLFFTFSSKLNLFT